MWEDHFASVSRRSPFLGFHRLGIPRVYYHLHGKNNAIVRQ